MRDIDRDRDRKKERNGIRCKQTPNRKTTMTTIMAEKREREKYIKKNQLCMSNIERKDMRIDRLVISFISKNNHINKAREDAILSSSLLFSLYLSLSLNSGTTETASRCPHCRSLTTFFFFYSSVYMLTIHVCVLTHTYNRKEERERERETKATEKKLLINIKKNVHELHIERSCVYVYARLRCSNWDVSNIV